MEWNGLPSTTLFMKKGKQPPKTLTRVNTFPDQLENAGQL